MPDAELRRHPESVRVVDSDGPRPRDLLGMGAAIATCVVAGFGLGYLADRPLGTSPGLALAGLAIGIVAACVYVYRVFKRFM